MKDSSARKIENRPSQPGPWAGFASSAVFRALRSFLDELVVLEQPTLRRSVTNIRRNCHSVRE